MGSRHAKLDTLGSVSRRSEAGYSLVEVMVSILLLSIAIIPMVAMFDTGLKAATTSGNYDRARTFANQQLEGAKNMSYDKARTGFPTGGCTPTSAQPRATCSNLTTGLPQGLSSYTVTKRFIDQSLDDTDVGDRDPGLMKIFVTVNWGGNSYTTTGVVGK